jgi:putative transcriptional regulator
MEKSKEKQELKLKASYKPLWHTLVDQGKKKQDLRDDLGLSPSTVAKLTSDKFVMLDVIARICQYLNCKIEEVVEFVPDKPVVNNQ